MTLFALCILGLALWNGLRLIQAIFFWSILQEFQAEPGPLYVAISGGFWLLAGFFIFWSLWLGKAWARFSALGGTAGYGSWYWVDRLVLQKPHSNWPFALIITVIFLLIALFILFSPRVRHFFQRDAHERKTGIKSSA